MFLLFMLVSLVAALLTTALVVAAFRGPISSILERIVDEAVASAWHRYLIFALFVVGISSGVNAWNLERHLPGGAATPPGAAISQAAAAITTNILVLEAYKAVLGSLRGLAAALLLFFGIGLVVSAIQRVVAERARPNPTSTRGGRQPDRSRSREPASRPVRDRVGEPRRSAPRRRSPDSRSRDDNQRGAAGSGAGARERVGGERSRDSRPSMERNRSGRSDQARSAGAVSNGRGGGGMQPSDLRDEGDEAQDRSRQPVATSYGRVSDRHT